MQTVFETQVGFGEESVVDLDGDGRSDDNAGTSAEQEALEEVLGEGEVEWRNEQRTQSKENATLRYRII